MSNLTISGKVSKILPIENGVSKAGKEWQKQSFVIDTEANFNPLVAFGVFGEDKCKEIISPLKEGDNVEVHFNISSREYQDKYYTQADCWRVKLVDGSVSETAISETPRAEEVVDDLPF